MNAPIHWVQQRVLIQKDIIRSVCDDILKFICVKNLLVNLFLRQTGLERGLVLPNNLLNNRFFASFCIPCKLFFFRNAMNGSPWITCLILFICKGCSCYLLLRFSNIVIHHFMSEQLGFCLSWYCCFFHLHIQFLRFCIFFRVILPSHSWSFNKTLCPLNIFVKGVLRTLPNVRWSFPVKIVDSF